ncbi:peptide ABC transporter substrate-binding protein [soil metagenome]
MQRDRATSSSAVRHVLLSRGANRRQIIAGSAGAALGALIGLPKLAAAQDSTPQAGGTALLALIQEPGQLNAFFNGQSGSFISVLTVEPLFVAAEDGAYIPVLASEVPTVENGGISADSMTITVKLLDGVLWSDGEPFTADDVAFTFAVYADPGSTTDVGAAYTLVESVTALDPLTVEIKMTAINPGYLDLFQQILPKHKYSTTAVTLEDPLSRIPLGTGPFVIDDWAVGDQISFVKSANYREEGKPLLDGITVKITPDKESTIAAYANGEYDYVYFVVTGDLPTLADSEDIAVEVREGGANVEWLWLNNSDGGDPTKPHPVLGDPAIREAIDYAIDRQSVIDEVLGGFGGLTGSFIFAGWAAVELPATTFDPDHARMVLDAAGWVEGDGGVREKDGIKASLRYQTIAGDLVRELYQQVVQQNLKDVGIEINIENVPSNTLFGSYDEGGIIVRGQFDITMSRDGYVVDPFEWVALFESQYIPSADFPEGFTYTFYSNPEFDEIAAQAAATLDQEVRKDLYAQLVEIFARDRPAIPLYRSASGRAYNKRLLGVTNTWFEVTGDLYSAKDWTLAE